MKKAVLSLFFVSLCFLCVSQSWTPKRIQLSYGIGGFYEYLPQGYNSSTKYPVIIFLHGIGEQGNGTSDLYKIESTGLPQVIKSGNFPTSFAVFGKSYSFVIICPQFSAWPSPDQVESVYSYVINNYYVDLNRVYLTGLSMGGGATWDYAGSSPSVSKKLAAVLPICGAAVPNDLGAKNIASQNLPVLATHNNDDDVVPVSNTIGWVDKINSNSPQTRAVRVVWPFGGHNAWSATYDPLNKFYNNMSAYEWMLQYSRESIVTPPSPPAPPPPKRLGVYPNPTSSSYVNLGFEYTGPTSRVTVLDSKGAAVKIVIVENTNPVRFDVSDLRSGIYFIRVGEMSPMKFIKL